MNKLIKIIFFLWFLMPVCVQAKAVTWQRIFNYNNQRSYGRDVLQTFDGGYIICGGIQNPVRTYLLKVNYLGLIEWEKILSDSTGNYLYANSIQQTDDSGYVMTGICGIDLTIARTDKNGNKKWIKRFNKTGGETRGYSIRITNDRGFITCGDFYSASMDKAYVVKVDSLGNLQWEKLFGDSLSYGNDIIQIPDGNYCLTGWKYSKPYNAFLKKIDSKGNEIWNSDFIQNTSYSKLLLLNKHSIIIAGLGYPFGIFFAKIDTSGKLLKQKTILTSNPEFYFSSMCLNSKGNIVIGGKERYPELIGTNDFASVVIDSNGNIIIQKRFETPQNAEDNCYSVKYTNDNGYIFVGDTEYDQKRGLYENILAIKTDSVLNTTPLISIFNNNNISEREYKLFQNYPNPFNSFTIFRYKINRNGFVKLVLVDILGREIESIVNGFQESGIHKITYNGNKLASGIYFVNIFLNNTFIESKKFTILK